jgi:hypothetical protein
VTSFDNGGVIPGPPTHARYHGVCPLDGYALVELEESTVTVDGEPVRLEGGWDHVIPPSELHNMSRAQQKIAAAHAFEAVAAAEQITQDEAQ